MAAGFPGGGVQLSLDGGQCDDTGLPGGIQPACTDHSSGGGAGVLPAVSSSSYRRRGQAPCAAFGTASVGLLVLLGVAAVLYFCFPTTYLSGGRDPGLYLINAIHIAETGSFQYASDPYMVQHYAALSGVARLDYPALYSAYEYGLTNDVGQVVPQFLPVLPAMLAVGYDLGGIGAAVRVNGVTGLLCLAAAYALVKPLYGGKAATCSPRFCW